MLRAPRLLPKQLPKATKHLPSGEGDATATPAESTEGPRGPPIATAHCLTFGFWIFSVFRNRVLSKTVRPPLLGDLL